jgi:type IV secretory pathway VirB2 component (pilin)
MGLLSNIIEWTKGHMGIVIAITLVLLITSIFLIGYGGFKENDKVIIGLSAVFLSIMAVVLLI